MASSNSRTPSPRRALPRSAGYAAQSRVICATRGSRVSRGGMSPFK